ncbi:hypothetical protein Vadar_011086 [Vaccinium darrowii]|uniref:Uncharacterized protein n=1 Tax=Vaccinium darrowii TaxID=229202 RepID=A0ACB7Y7P3_9ERIC|nr:hypothetical protein Vadar_011086 [Vaccinium darrowii]
MQVHPSSCGTSVDTDRLEYVVKDDAQSNVNIQVDWGSSWSSPSLYWVTLVCRFIRFFMVITIFTLGDFGMPYAGSSWLTPLQAAVGVVQQDLRPTIPKNTDPKLVELLERCWQQNPTLRHDFSEIIEMLQQMAKEVICQRFSL